MRIAFDAKRSFFNNTGLGNYSRFIIESLAKFQQEEQYLLFSPKEPQSFYPKLKQYQNCELHLPNSFFAKKLSSLWRIWGINADLEKQNVSVFHGLSNELPFGIGKTKLKKIVTIHDLIFLHFPHFYKPIDRWIYTKKSRYACQNADTIIAISQQTKRDIIHFFGIDENKIEVLYQDCDSNFYTQIPASNLEIVQKKYGLNSPFILCVGTIENRKNQLTLVKAFAKIREQNQTLKLVLIGRKTDYFIQIQDFVSENQLEEVIIFLENIPFEDLPSIYKLAEIFVYPSLFEGFGIPVLEAMNSGIPVITTKGTCMEEVGEEACLYFDGKSVDKLAKMILDITQNETAKAEMIEKGLIQAKKFRAEKLMQQLINIYTK